MRPARALIAALIAATATAGIGLTHEAAHAAGSKSLSVYPSDPVKNEKVTFVGQLTTPVERRVVLQYKTKNYGWKYFAETDSANGSGYFSLSRAITRSRTYRYYAPKATVDGTKLASITGYSRRMNVVAAQASISLTPARQCLGQNKQIIVIATFSPIREGRTVSFSTQVGPVAGQQDHRGKVGIAVGPGGEAGTFSIKATAAALNGAPTKSTPSASYAVVANCP